MEITGLKNIQKTDDSAIYYIRTYTATAEISLPIKEVEMSFRFTIENGPLGSTISYAFENLIDYPLLPLKKKLKECILKADSEGLLPC